MLVQAIRGGNREAAFELDRRWRPRLVRLARSILHDDGLAQDAAQVALWRTCLNLDRYDDDRSFEPWILKIGGNCARDLQRKEKQSRDVGDDRMLENVPAPSELATDPLIQAEEIQALDECTDGLADRSLTVITLFSTGGSLSEIGRALHKPKNTVQGWLNKALEQLRRCLATKGFSQQE